MATSTAHMFMRAVARRRRQEKQAMRFEWQVGSGHAPCDKRRKKQKKQAMRFNMSDAKPHAFYA